MADERADQAAILDREINAALKKYRRTDLRIAIRVGAMLHQRKDLLKHGEWGQWLKGRRGLITERTAQDWMRLYHGYESASDADLGKLTYGEALKRLGRESAPRARQKSRAVVELERQLAEKEQEISALHWLAKELADMVDGLKQEVAELRRSRELGPKRAA